MIRQPLRPALGALSRAAALLTIALVTAACGGGEEAARWDAKSIEESVVEAPFRPINVNSNLGVGETRLAFALFKPDQSLIVDAEVTVRLYRLADQPEQHPTEARSAGTFPMTARTIDVAAEHQVARLGGDRLEGARASQPVALAHDHARTLAAPAPAHDGALTTMYTAMVKFDQPGHWGAELDVNTDGKRYSNLRVTMFVQPHTTEPAVGDPAPRSKQKTVRDVQDIAEIDTARAPNPELHSMTVDEAIASGKPTVVAFVTPLFCQTRFCGPVLSSAVLPAWKQYRDRVQFVHIEPYDVPAARKGKLEPVPAVQEWRLQSEPFIAVLDRHGIVTAKLEGIVALEELARAVEAAIAKP